MASAPILGSKKTVDLPDEAYGAEFHEALVHECVRAELAARRQGTASTKTRGKVRGGGAKPWRQKGTGRARAGSSRSPIWVGGGTVFGPSPRHYTFKINKKQRKIALRSALSLHARRGSLAALDAGAFADAPSTKAALSLLDGWDRATGRVLVILGEGDDRAALSFRNLPRATVITSSSAGISDLVGARAVLATQASLEALGRRVTGVPDAATEEASA